MKPYLFVQQINDSQEIVLDPSTKELCRRKHLKIYDENVYHYLKEHSHPNIVSILDYTEDNGNLVIVEKEIEGETLRHHLDQNDLSEKDKRIIFDEILDGIEFLHQANPPIIHRDIKAENIMLNNHHIVKIIDFNAARIYTSHKTRDTVLIGTEGSAAPEQYGFGESDARTDIYALGKLAEEMFPQKKEFIAKATALDPDSRYQNIKEMRKAFHNPLTPYGWLPFSINVPKTMIRFILFQLLFIWIASLSSSSFKDQICVLLIFETLYMLYAQWTPLFHLMRTFESKPVLIRIFIYAFVSFGIVFLFASFSLLLP